MNVRYRRLRSLLFGAAAIFMLAAVVGGCGSGTTVSVVTPKGSPTVAPPRLPNLSATLTVTSTSFANGGTIPAIEAFGGCGGTDGPHGESPDLTWTAGPAGTQSYVVTMFDTDAPTGSGFWHWVAFNIPSTTTSLTLNQSASGMPAGTVQGTNDYGFSGYGGPCPPVGDPPHHYYITVSALNVATLPAGVTSASSGAFVTFNMDANVIAQGVLLGLYAQP
jgi:Raf kinase inhibitor-like YbhB/YbcL family protein